MPRSVLFVHNPGSRRGAAVAAAVRRRIGPGDPASRWIPVSELSAEADFTPDRVLAIGGDGTANAACQWLRDRDLSRPLGLVPAGTGNNLARGLGLPRDTPRALDLALESPAVRAIDLMRYWSEDDPRPRVAIQTMALAFPAEIAARYDRLREKRWFRTLCRPLGPQIYRLLALAGLRDQQRRDRRGETCRLSVCLPEESFEEDVVAVFVGNEPSIGGNFFPCPHAKLDDGKVDVCFVRAGAGVSYLKLFKAVARGEHLGLSDTIRYLQTAGPIDFDLSRASPLLADGDVWLRSTRYHLEVEPGRQAIVVA